MEKYENLSSTPSRIPASEQLRNIAKTQETTLEAKNEFKEGSNEYGATNEEVIKNISINDTYFVPNMANNFYSPNKEYKSPE